MSNQPLSPNAKKYIIIPALIVAIILGSLTALWLVFLNRPEQYPFAQTVGCDVALVVFGGIPGGASNYINMTLANTGISAWTLTNTAQVQETTTYGAPVTNCAVNSTYGLTCAPGYDITIRIANVNWISGHQYLITVPMTSSNGIALTSGYAAPGGHSPDPDPNPNNIPSVPSSVASFPLSLVASLIAIIIVVALLGAVLVKGTVYNRKHSQLKSSSPANPLKPTSTLK